MDVRITCLRIAKRLKCLIMGTSKGSIRVSAWPMTDDNLLFQQLNPNSNKVVFQVPEFYELTVHNCAITSLCLSQDEQYLITGDEQGMVFLMKVKDVLDKGVTQDTFRHFSTEEKQRQDQNKNDIFLASTQKIIHKNYIRKKLESEGSALS